MNNKRVKVIVTDLDGTMLHHQNVVTKRNYNAVTQAKEKGILYVVATGRCKELIPKKDLPSYDYLITSNGSVIYEGATEKVIYMNAISTEHALAALEIIRKYNPFLELFVNGKIVIEKNTLNHLESYWVPLFHREYFKNDKQVVVSSFEEYLTHMNSTENGVDKYHITKINMPYNEYGKRNELREELQNTKLFSMTSDGSGIELTNPDVNKGNAISWLCNYLKIDLQEVLAFGDGANDKEMIKRAGIGVAMENAIPQLKEYADAVTDCHDSDGIAQYLEKYVC